MALIYLKPSSTIHFVLIEQESICLSGLHAAKPEK